MLSFNKNKGIDIYDAFGYRLFCWKLKIEKNKKIISDYYSH